MECSQPLGSAEARGAGKTDMQDTADRLVERAALDDGNVAAPSTVENRRLERADLRQAVEVLVERALTVGCGFAHPEPAAMSLLVLDCEHDVDDERVFVLGAHHPRDEVDTFEHHRPALGKRALDR